MARFHKTAEKEQAAPFASLLAVSSLVFALLLVAGFSYRWTYFYNFGLRDLALQAPVQSIAVSALELVRTPRDALWTFCIVVGPLLLLNAALYLLARYFPQSSSFLGLKSRLGLDSLRAIVLIYSAYWAGSESGWKKFEAQITETRGNTLPTVTAVLNRGPTESVFPFSCTPAEWSSSNNSEKSEKATPPVIGAPTIIRNLREGLACNVPQSRSWRRTEMKNLYICSRPGVTLRVH
jgi:hypothetical protein